MTSSKAWDDFDDVFSTSMSTSNAISTETSKTNAKNPLDDNDDILGDFQFGGSSGSNAKADSSNANGNIANGTVGGAMANGASPALNASAISSEEMMALKN